MIRPDDREPLSRHVRPVSDGATGARSGDRRSYRISTAVSPFDLPPQPATLRVEVTHMQTLTRKRVPLIGFQPHGFASGPIKPGPHNHPPSNTRPTKKKKTRQSNQPLHTNRQNPIKIPVRNPFD